jgi:hypothetical protein
VLSTSSTLFACVAASILWDAEAKRVDFGTTSSQGPKGDRSWGLRGTIGHDEMQAFDWVGNSYNIPVGVAFPPGRINKKKRQVE